MSAPKFYPGDTVRRIGFDHPELKVGQTATVFRQVSQTNYQLSSGPLAGSHKEHNLELEQAGELRKWRESLASEYGYSSLAEFESSPKLTPTIRSPEVSTPIDFYVTPKAQAATFVSSKARNVEEAKADLANAEAALAAEIKSIAFTTAINTKIRLAASIVSALSDVREFESGRLEQAMTRTEYAEFKSELCSTLKEYGYKVVYVGNKAKATIVKV